MFVSRLAVIEQERRDRELALRLAENPDALDAEAQQGPQVPLQRCGDNTIRCLERCSPLIIIYKSKKT